MANSKIEMEVVKMVLQRNEPDVRKVTSIMQELEMELKAQEEEKANKPKGIKKQFTILISDADGALQGKDIVGWVVQLPEGDNPATAPERIISAAGEFNATPKGRRMTLESIGEACELVSARIFKEHGVWVKTKTPVQAFPLPNKIAANLE